MRVSRHYLTFLCVAILALAGFSSHAAAQTLFSDDFEDRVADQVLIGNNWTWYDQWFDEEGCSGDVAGGYGPFDDGDSSDYEQENRNFITAGADESYFRAGLEVPAWPDAEGNPVVLSNMLRVYGNQYNTNATCQRTLIFQEMDAPAAGVYSFMFDVAYDKDGAPENGEITGAFVKVLDPANGYETVLFEWALTTPPAATTPEDVTAITQAIEFTITEELVGKLLQFGFYNDVTPSLDQSWGTSAALYDNITLTPLPIGPAHSGSWFNSDQSGHGFALLFGQTPSGVPLAVAYWYIYDNLGNPIFLVGTGIPEGNTVEITLTSPIGMIFGDFDPSTMPTPHNDGGTAVLEFTDRDNMIFSYTPSDFTATEWGHTPIESLPMTKLFGIPADKIYGATE